MSTKAEQIIKSYKIMLKYVVANYFCKKLHHRLLIGF